MNNNNECRLSTRSTLVSKKSIRNKKPKFMYEAPKTHYLFGGRRYTTWRHHSIFASQWKHTFTRVRATESKTTISFHWIARCFNWPCQREYTCIWSVFLALKLWPHSQMSIFMFSSSFVVDSRMQNHGICVGWWTKGCIFKKNLMSTNYAATILVWTLSHLAIILSSHYVFLFVWFRVDEHRRVVLNMSISVILLHMPSVHV